jgi:phosphoribosyl-ATP pyrophosphohydrolase/phosphoribosyl-AMP cyclohydrolase
MNKPADGLPDLSGLCFDTAGLIPAIVQDAATGRVLTLAYMNRESLERTLASGETWFYSRSRQSLWHKGETSGHTQAVRSISPDCDGDALLVLVEPRGPACHTGAETCFAETAPGGAAPVFDILRRLEERVAQRHGQRPEGAYTTYLFEKGLDKILKKLGEEATEVIIGGKNGDPSEVVYESADLLYHLLVLLRQQGVSLQDVLRELAARYGEVEQYRKGGRV